MSSYANHHWTPEREQIAHWLVDAALNLDDDGFGEIIEQAASDGDIVAVAALLAEQLLNDEEEPDGRQPECCPDCGTNVMPDTPPGSHDWQRYMVHDRVWQAAGLTDEDSWFCIPCLETRLQRPLSGADLTDVGLNEPGRDDDTPHLAALKRAASALRNA